MVKAFVKNKKTLIVLGLIILVAAFFRLYRIGEYMTFLGDEGRDVIIVRRFLVNGDIFLIGPGTSIGNMYLGPLYYYLMAPALLLANFSPVGPSAQIALLSLVTVVLIWKVGSEWFSDTAGLIAAFLYAISPTVIIYSRSSWNPNIMPFFALLCVYAIWRVFKADKYFWLPVLGVSYAFVLQSHYLGLLLLPALGIFWILTLYVTKSKTKFVKYSLIALVIFAALMSPLVIFDARHGWRNYDALKTFFTVRQTTVSIRPWNALPGLWPQFQEIFTRLVAGRHADFGMWASLFTLLGIFAVFTKAQKKLSPENYSGFFILGIWLVVALGGLALYKQHIYDHYYGFFFPVPFLLIGGLSDVLIRYAKIRGSWIVLTALVFLTYFNFLDSPLRYGPNRQMQRSVEVAKLIQEESKGEKFNLAVIAERNYEDAYEYFLLKNNAKVTDIDPQHYKETVTSQLFVVCELPKEKCDPTHNSKAEVANFGWSEIAQEWETQGVIVYKLVHSQQ